MRAMDVGFYPEDGVMTLEGDDLRGTFAANPFGRRAVSFAVHPHPDDTVCPGHVEFYKWVNWILTQPAEDDEYYN